MTEHQLGDAPITPEFREMMNGLARLLDEAFNGDAKGAARKVGFVLLSFPYNDGSGRCNFISNGADRKDIIVLFREMIARFEGQAGSKGGRA